MEKIDFIQRHLAIMEESSALRENGPFEHRKSVLK
jgi:hypothetical protein